MASLLNDSVGAKRIRDVYNALEEAAEYDDEYDAKVFHGSTTGILDDLEINRGYYSRIFSQLKAGGCIEQLRRGGGNGASMWIIRRPPSAETTRKATINIAHASGDAKMVANAELVRRIEEIDTKLFALATIVNKMKNILEEAAGGINI